MKKATHYGTCQVCGRNQKAPNGLVAKHGYTVDGGFFNGVCFGSDELPFEQDRTVLGTQIERLTKNIKHRKVHLEDVKQDKEPVLIFMRFTNPEDKWGYSREKAWVRIISETEDTITVHKDHVPYKRVPDPLHYKTEVDADGNFVVQAPRYERNYKEDYVYFLDRRITLLEITLKDMKARYDSWERKELTPV